MADAKALIEFLRECHLADNREAGIFDVFGSKVTHLHFLPGPDLLSDGTLEEVVVPSDWAEPAAKAAMVYKRERSLIYAPFLLMARLPTTPGRAVRVCAPLVWYPIQLEETEVGIGSSAVAIPDLASPRLNFPVLAALVGEQADAGDRLEDFWARWPDAPFTPSSLHEIASGLRECIPTAEVDRLYLSPRITAESEVRKLESTLPSFAPARCECHCAPFLAIVENSPDVRGVLFELGTLAQRGNQSLAVPLLSLLAGSADSKPLFRKPRAGQAVPAILSEAQTRLLQVSTVAPLTLVIGPPGTGKTFTVAAMALEHVSCGESVLFAARTEHALEVIADKLEKMLGVPGFIVRAGRKDFLRDLKDFFADLLRGAIPLPEVGAKEIRRLRREMRRLTRDISKTERLAGRLVGAQAALSETGKLSAPPGWLMRLRNSYFEWVLAGNHPLWEHVRKYQALLEERMQVQSRLLQGSLRIRLEKTIRRHRKECFEFLGALKARTSSKQEEILNGLDMSILLHAFPVWLVDLSRMHRVLPLERHLFDTVVLDEATHCDLASCLPALQRGRRAVVTGDPKQLRHISFLSIARQQAIGEKLGLSETETVAFDYRAKSLLDRTEEAVGSSQDVIFLDEHYRSRPLIIEFSNRNFYRNALKIMTAAPSRDDRYCMELRRVNGERTASGANRVEAAAVVDELCRLIDAEKRIDDRLCHSVGVLSPFREQVEELQRLVLKRVSAQAIEKHAIRLGTPYGFQGEERDVVFISFAVDRSATGPTFRYLNRPDVFNVAVTRARLRQVLFCSMGISEAPPGSLFRLYLEAVGRTDERAPEGRSQDEFCSEVCSRLVREGCETYRAYPVAGLNLDLVAVLQGRPLGIDLIGSGGDFAAAFPLERYRMLQRAGLPVFPLPFFAWQRDPEGCVRAVLDRLRGK